MGLSVLLHLHYMVTSTLVLLDQNFNCPLPIDLTSQSEGTVKKTSLIMNSSQFYWLYQITEITQNTDTKKTPKTSICIYLQIWGRKLCFQRVFAKINVFFTLQGVILTNNWNAIFKVMRLQYRLWVRQEHKISIVTNTVISEKYFESLFCH